MEIKKMIAEILENKKVDEFHIKFWDKVDDEEESEECVVNVDMKKEYF